MWVQWVKNNNSSISPMSSMRSSSFSASNSFHLKTSPFSSFRLVELDQVQVLQKPGPVHQGLKDFHTLLSDPSQKHPSIFHRVRAWVHRQAHPHSHSHSTPPPDSQNKVVLYYTSLRVVRRTYEDCRAVGLILSGYRVRMDERDLAVDSAYVEELEKVCGLKKEKVVKKLPRVYIDGKYIGGVDEVRRMHENGELVRLLREIPADEGSGRGGGCAVCGGSRYVVCEYCDGSHKVYVGKEDGFMSCSLCNVDGLIKCPCCTSVVF